MSVNHADEIALTDWQPCAIEPIAFQGTYLKIWYAGTTGKTERYTVLTNDGILLGTIKWFSKWRKYAFFPSAETLFEESCLGEIANFLLELKAVRKAKLKRK